jgi:hypothetical protein
MKYSFISGDHPCNKGIQPGDDILAGGRESRCRSSARSTTITIREN